MGWSSWNCWGDHVAASHVLASARAMDSEGLAAHGWSYVNIDDAWQGERAATGDRALQPNEKFPDMAGLVASIHDLGLRAGIYSSPWAVTYAGYPGDSSDDPSGRHFAPLPTRGNWWTRRARLFNGKGGHSFAAADCAQFARWGFDYLKYDWFPIDGPATRACAAALRATGRDIVLSLSNSLALSTLPEVLGHAQLWRTTNDLRDAWTFNPSTPLPFQGVRDVARWHEAFQPYQSPGAWNDPDMLVLGRVGWGPELRPTRLTPDEQTTHFALWCLWSAPLLIGCPLDQLDAHTRSLLTNADLIDLDQDAAGVQAWSKPLGSGAEHIAYHKPLANGDTAIGLFNFSDRDAELGFDFRTTAERPRDTQLVLDCLAQRPLGERTNRLTTLVPSHGCAVYRLSDPG
jgi:alpha-galactosidase